MAVTFNPAKRDKTLSERGLDFADATEVFNGPTLDFEDRRKDYGERRFVCIGHLRDRMVVIAWTPRGDHQHVFSMRKANEREQKNYGQRFGQS